MLLLVCHWCTRWNAGGAGLWSAGGVGVLVECWWLVECQCWWGVIEKVDRLINNRMIGVLIG